MTLITKNLIVDTILLCTVPIIALFLKYLFNYTYWKKKNVFYFTPTFPFGNFTRVRLLRTSMHEFHTEMYNKIKFDLKLPYAGLYHLDKPVLMVTDPDLVKHILIKDFDHFVDRGLNDVDEVKEPVEAHLFNKTGNSWKRLRNKLTPTFTSGKMKNMFPLIEHCSEHLVQTIEKQLHGETELDIKDYCARFTTDVICSAAFGLDINSLENPDSEFRKISMILLKPTLKQILKAQLVEIVPFVKRVFNLSLLDERVASFFLDLVKNTLEYREKNGVHRDDFLNIMMGMKIAQRGKEIAADDVAVTDMVIAAQTFVFFFAGFETSSSLLTFCLYEMARNQDIQKKLRQEILDTKKALGGKLDYEAIQKLPLLDKVSKEALRKYPSLPQLDRITTKPYQIPNSDVTLDVGTKISIPTMAFHYDPEFYPDPQRFDPERFSSENVEVRPHYTYLPFGDGPRNCIGLRFGVMQFKTGLADLLSTFEFNIDPDKSNFEYGKEGILLQTKQSIALKVKRIS